MSACLVDHGNNSTRPRYLELDIDYQIANWVAWSLSRAGGGGHWGSIEKWYRPPKHFHPESPHSAIDTNAALTVERAMNDMPAQHRTGLILHYAGFAPSRFICRKLALRHEAWEQFLKDGRTMLTNLLLRTGKWRIPSS